MQMHDHTSSRDQIATDLALSPNALAELLPQGWSPTVPLVRISTCGQLAIGVLHQIQQRPNERVSFVYGQPATPHQGGATALNLLKLLVSQPGRFATKDWLMEKLHHSKSEEEEREWGGLVRLDNIVSLLRGVLCPIGMPGEKKLRKLLVERVPATPQSGYGYRLAAYPLIWLDVEALSAHVHQACELEATRQDARSDWLAAYQLSNKGPFLAEGPYSDWAMERREEVEGYLWQSVQALWHIAIARQEGGEEEALRLLREYWLRHIENEDSLRPLIELLAKRGDYQRAEEYYAKLCEALNIEGKEPNIRTQKTMIFLRSSHYLPAHERVDLSGTPKSNPSLPQSSERIMRQETFTQFAPVESVRDNVLALPISIAHQGALAETTIPDCATRFGITLAQMITLIQQWYGMAKFCHMLQDQLDQTIKGLDMLKSYYSLEAYALSRRSFLIALAALPTFLIDSSRQKHKLALELEEFLPQCAASIIACWHLSSASQLDTISPIIDSYVPTLITITKTVPSYREIAADLIAQCYFLKTILAWHLKGLSVAEACCTQAMYYSDIAQNTNLRLNALNQYALISYYAKQFPKALAKSEEALAMLQHASHEHIFPIVQGRVYMYLAAIQAQQNLGDPEKTIEQARQSFINQSEVVEAIPLYADCGDAPLTLWDGLTNYHLSFHKRVHMKPALTSLRIFGKLQASTNIPERFRLECLTNRTLAAIQCNELDEAIECFEAGKHGAKALKSQQRIAEVEHAYQEMNRRWASEERIKKLEI